MREEMIRDFDKDWLFILGLSVTISWLGALAVWVFPSWALAAPVEFGVSFSIMSLIGCTFGWAIGRWG